MSMPTEGEQTSPPLCEADGCGKPRRRGNRRYCAMPVYRLWKHGSLDLPPRKPKPPRQPRECEVDGCNKPGRRHGRPLCAMHEARMRRTGTFEPGRFAHGLTVQQHYWRDVVKTEVGCWGWNGATSQPWGYARIGSVYGHRLSYEIHHGPIPDGLLVMHKCDNPPCTNPDHLMLGTIADNSADMAKKGRAPRAHAKLDWERVAEIRRLHAAGTRVRELAAMFGVVSGTVNELVAYKTWKPSKTPSPRFRLFCGASQFGDALTRRIAVLTANDHIRTCAAGDASVPSAIRWGVAAPRWLAPIGTGAWLDHRIEDVTP